MYQHWETILRQERRAYALNEGGPKSCRARTAAQLSPCAWNTWYVGKKNCSSSSSAAAVTQTFHSFLSGGKNFALSSWSNNNRDARHLAERISNAVQKRAFNFFILWNHIFLSWQRKYQPFYSDLQRGSKMKTRMLLQRVSINNFVLPPWITFIWQMVVYMLLLLLFVTRS